MSEPMALPPIKTLRGMLLDMLGRNVQLNVAEVSWSPTLRDPGAIAAYVDDHLRLRAFIVCDLPLSAALGASIALIPARTAAGCVEEGRLTNDMAENLHEVLNILAALFNMPDQPHVKLSSVCAPGDPPPPDLSAQLRSPQKREDLTIEVAGYGGGRLALLLA